MGLDISVSKYNGQDIEDDDDVEFDYETWKAVRDAAEEELGDAKSVTQPEHMFTKRYLRSSYNSGGFNSFVPTHLGSNAESDLYWVFEPLRTDWYETADAGVITPDDLLALDHCKKRALDLAKRIEAVTDPVYTRDVSLHGLKQTMKDKEAGSKEWAIQIYRKWVEERPDGLGSWSSALGDTFGDEGETILAAIPGVDIIGTPCVHLILKSNTEATDWYRDAALITAEFIDETKRIVERYGKAYIVWSG